MAAQKIKLGRNYRDTLTGFEGRAVARHEWENGCVRYTLESAELHDGKLVEQTFDEQRLESVSGRAPRATAKAGGPRSAPSRPAPPAR